MKKVVIGILAVVLLVGATVSAFYLGKQAGAPPVVQELTPAEDNVAEDNVAKDLGANDEVTGADVAGEGINVVESNGDGVILFKIENFILTDDSVVLEGKRCGAFLRWTPDEDWVTSHEEPAKFEVSNEVIMDYYTAYIQHSVVEITGGEVGDYFNTIYEDAHIKAKFVYLHMQNKEVIYIQQILDICY